MKCADYKANVGAMFGFGGPRTVPCNNEATHAVRLGVSAVKTVNGWRPLCWIHAGTYPGYTVEPISESGIDEHKIMHRDGVIKV